MALLLGLGGIGLLVPGVAVDAAAQRFGDVTRDEALDDAAVLKVATLISSDRLEGRRIVSFEYFHEDDLFVGYQRVPRDLEVAEGDLVDAEVAPAQPEVARLVGTRLAPRGWITDSLRKAERASWWLGVLCLSGAFALVVAGWKRRE